MSTPMMKRIALALLVALSVAACSAHASSAPPAASSAPPIAAATPSPTPAPTPAKPQIVARFSGSGDQTTASFATPASWHLSWWYSCSSFGQSGNFVVSESDTNGSPDFNGVNVNELGMGQGPVATYVYGDAGSHYLSIDSECDWSVVVVSGG